MAAISWKNAVNGDWSTAADWSTGTVPGASDTVTISLTSGPYIVTISSADLANSLTFNAPSAALYENAGSLTMAGALTVDSGFVSLNKANTIGSVALAGGVLAFGNAGALGAGTVTVSGGELLATANETLGNDLTFSGTSTIAAAHGTTLNKTGFVTINTNSTLNFGALGQDGVVLWYEGGGWNLINPYTINVVAGTLKAADSSLAFIINYGASPTTVAAGATLDTGGFGLSSLTDLLGGGAVIDSGGAATLTLNAANFSGAIGGPLSLVAGGIVTLSGANSYSGTTTINSGDLIELGLGGATGSIGGGAISDGGTFIIDRNNAVTLSNAISGAGILEQLGTGVTSINTANTYSGGTFLSGGVLAIGNGGALGTGVLTFNNGEFLGTATETFADAIDLSGTTTFAAAPGTTLNLTGNVTFAGSNTVDIGAPGQDGEVLWGGAPFGTATGDTFDVLDGTLTAANSGLEIALSAFQGTTVEAGATLDWAGNGADINNLQGAGTVTNSGGAQDMTLYGTTNFSGTISGALSVIFEGNASLSGLEDYTGSALLVGAITVANSGTYDIVSNNGIFGTPTSFFINNGLFDKTGGVSVVTSDFVNNGTLNVLHGSVQFGGGFTNNGVIHGAVSQSGGVTTISAAAPSDFNGNAMPDILWRQSGSNTLADWSMNGSTISQSQVLSAAPDSSWSVAGIGDFNGDGKADILWRQSSSGTVADWTMNGGVIAQSNVLSAAPDSSWSVAGIGDFNGDGDADILWRQSGTNTLADWSMNGSTISQSSVLSVAPDSSWSVAGIGDFNGDGNSDILWRQSGTGLLADWSMNGSTISQSNVLSVAPDSSWSVAGIGDFNGDGNADILWRQSGTNTLAEWLMNGSTISSSQVIAASPDATWSVVEVGDFNGDGKSDILWQQSTTGMLADWTMNGSAISASNVLSSAPDSTWSVQAKPTDLA